MTTTDETPRNFLGVPIVGDITHGRSRKDQRTKEEFAQLMKPVLDDPTVRDFGWRQYTPYFNDGDECVFSAGDMWLRTMKEAPRPYEERFLNALKDQLRLQYFLTADSVLRCAAEAFKQVPLATVPEPEPEDDEEGTCLDFDRELFYVGYSSHHDLGEIKYSGWGVRPDGTHGRLDERYEGPDEARFRRCEALSNAVGGGAFDLVLLELFGDHADIRISRDGIQVEFYEHG